MKHRILLLLALLAVISSAYAQSLDDLAKASSSISTLQAHFTQTKQSAMLAEPVVMQGCMWFDNPQSLRWEYTTPTSQIMIVSGDSIATRSGNQVGTSSLSNNRMAKHLMPMIMNLVSGKSLTDHRLFNITTSTKDHIVIVELQPAKKQMQRMFQKIVLNFDSTTKMLSSVVLEEKADTRTTIEFSQVKINQPLPNNIFNINTPRP